MLPRVSPEVAVASLEKRAQITHTQKKKTDAFPYYLESMLL